jgi:hypothetical protein
MSALSGRSLFVVTDAIELYVAIQVFFNRERSFIGLLVTKDFIRHKKSTAL